jgi:hypothetical protein
MILYGELMRMVTKSIWTISRFSSSTYLRGLMKPMQTLSQNEELVFWSRCEPEYLIPSMFNFIQFNIYLTRITIWYNK